MFSRFNCFILLFVSTLSFGNTIPDKIAIEQMKNAHESIAKEVLISGYLLVDDDFATLYQGMSDVNGQNN